MVENLPANAEDTGSSPGLGGSHMPWSNWAREPQLLSLRVWSLCSATREAAMKSGPHLPQLEKALAQKRRPNIAINQSINQSNKSLKKKKKTADIGSQYMDPLEKGLRIRQGLGMFHWNTHIIHDSDRGSHLLSVSVLSLLRVLAYFSSSYPVR